MQAKQIKKFLKKVNNDLIDYEEFVRVWNVCHTISKAPSFTSWKKFYKNKN